MNSSTFSFGWFMPAVLQMWPQMWDEIWPTRSAAPGSEAPSTGSSAPSSTGRCRKWLILSLWTWRWTTTRTTLAAKSISVYKRTSGPDGNEKGFEVAAEMGNGGATIVAKILLVSVIGQSKWLLAFTSHITTRNLCLTLTWVKFIFYPVNESRRRRRITYCKNHLLCHASPFYVRIAWTCSLVFC